MSVGQSPLRHDAAAKTDGSIEYAGDAVPAGALHAVVVFSGRAHARMLSMSTDAARAVPGVVDIITAADASHTTATHTHTYHRGWRWMGVILRLASCEAAI